MDISEESLALHYKLRGKLEVVSRYPIQTQKDLSLAYTPGVAAPCLEIQKDPAKSFQLTRRQNLVAVITDGSAVLGLGDIGPEAGMPVMEGKCVLFKEFGGVDAFPLCVDTKDVDKLVETIALISKSFGGINLEDIAAPRCFEVEAKLKERLDIPVFHDDQHGTAVITVSAMLNALKLVGKNIEEVSAVVNGAGAAAIACARLFVELGIRRENMVLCDSHGAVTVYREDINPMKREFATTRRITTLAEALHDADVFLGVSKADVFRLFVLENRLFRPTPEMLRTMSGNPIVMALANPDPEIAYDTAMLSRPDIIFATGRSDYPNQVNNVLGFPYIFRGALDVRATKINEEMKLAAAHALAELTRQPVPTMVLRAYGVEKLEFGRTYLIPKPLDPRLLCTVAPAVAKAAVESGVAKQPIADWDAYAESLRKRYQE